MTIRLFISLSFFLFADLAHGQNINVELSKLFFNADVSKLDKYLLVAFLRDSALHKSKESTDTVFNPPRIREIKYLVQHNFTFRKNSFLKTPFIDGNLGVIIGQDFSDNDYTVLFLAFEFKNKSDLDSAYSELIGNFQQLGNLDIKSRVPEAAEVTNIDYQKKLEIFKVLFPSSQPESYILYVYLKKMKT